MRAPDPVRVGDLHLDGPIHPICAGPRYSSARLLARLHGVPVAEVHVPLPGGRASAEQVAAATWAQAGPALVAHLVEDGLPAPTAVPVAGLAAPGVGVRCRDLAVTDGTPSVTVVIATRDRTASLARTLTSIARMEHPGFDVVVVDSAPTSDATARLLAGRVAADLRLTYVRTEHPGLGLAHNAALPFVSGQVVAFTDDDVQVDPGWLTALAGPFLDPDVACVTGLILPAELETAAQLWVEQAGGFGRGFSTRRFSATEPDGPLFPFTAGQFGSGANMAYRTDWLRQACGFDIATGAGTPARGGDDLLTFLRVILDGKTLVYQPAAIVRHWHRREYAGMRRQAFGYGMGLGAYLTAALCRHPGTVAPMLRRAVPALTHLLAPGSARNRLREDNYPSELVWRERAGVLAGPAGYASSRWRYRHVRVPVTAASGPS